MKCVFVLKEVYLQQHTGNIMYQPYCSLAIVVRKHDKAENFAKMKNFHASQLLRVVSFLFTLNKVSNLGSRI